MYEVSDYAVACILAFNRRLFPLAQAVRSGIWKSGSLALMKARGNMRRLSQQTLGLIGMGRIGSLVVQKVKGFGMRILVFDPYVSADAAHKLGAEVADLDGPNPVGLYLHPCPADPRDETLLGLPQFKKMKPTAYLINAARGGPINEEDLHQALTRGYLAGAALDVTDPEPPDPDHPLLHLDQVLVTGHSSWFSDASVAEGFRLAAEAVVSALNGQWPAHLANPEVKLRKNGRIGRGPA